MNHALFQHGIDEILKFVFVEILTRVARIRSDQLDGNAPLGSRPVNRHDLAGLRVADKRCQPAPQPRCPSFFHRHVHSPFSGLAGLAAASPAALFRHAGESKILCRHLPEPLLTPDHFRGQIDIGAAAGTINVV